MLIEEASIDTLFHVTPATVAIKILEQDSFLLALSETNTSESFVSWLDKNGVNVNIKRNISKLFYLSFARTPASGYIADRASGLSSVKEPVMLVVNGKRLKNLNRSSTFVPQDYWHNSDANGRQLGAAREAEERFYSSNPRAKLGSSLIEIRIIADTSGNDRLHSSLRKLIILCKKKNILLKLFSEDNKAGFIRGIETVEDRAKALSFIISKTNKEKPWPQYDREPDRDLLFLKDLLEKNSYEELSSKDRSSIYYYLGGTEIYGDLAKYFSDTIHNIRGGKDSDKEFLYDLLKKNNITSLSKMFIMLQAKWTRLRDEYNVEEDRKWSLKNEATPIEEALVKPSFPIITGHSDNWGNALTIWMAQQGFKKLGMGAYGHVFKHPNLSYVLKVYIDEGYDKWISICQKLKGNPYVPVFRGKPFKVGPFSVIRMENLKSLEKEDNFDLSKDIDSYIRGVVSKNKFKKISKEPNSNEKVWEEYFGKDHTLFTDKKLAQVTDKLIKFFDKNPKYKVDLFHSNFMERNGKLVIIDPIAYASYPTKALTLTDKSYSKQSEKASSEEASIDTLFHSTDPMIALKALKEGSFLLPLSETNASEKFIRWLDKNGIRKVIRRNSPKLFYLSFARTPASGYIADRGQGLNAVNHSVLFVVNGRELRTHNRETVFAPFDYWYNSDDTGRQNGAAREAEERLFSANPKVKFLKSLIEIRIFAKDGNEFSHAALRKLVLYCKKNDIKLKLFSSSNKPGFLLGKENPDDRALALKIILSKTDKSKPWPMIEREPLSDLKFLVDLIEKQSYYDLSEKQRSSLYYYLQDNPVYGDLAKHFDSTIHNLRSGRESDKTFLYDVLKRNKIKSIDEMFQMLQSKWTKLRDKYNEEEERKYQEEYKKRTEAASLEELALFKANIPDVTNRKWRANLTKWAKSKGFKAIGKGKYGKVFYSELKPNIVIKVFSDASYKFWYKVAVANKGNSAVPKFIGKPVKIADGLWAVRMEKLEPLNSTQKVATWMIETFTKFHAKENYGIPTASNFKKVTHADVHDIRKTVITDDMEELLMDLLWNLSKGENGLKYTLDLHSGNFMRRGDTIVLVDPLQNVTERLRSMFKIDRPTTHEDAMADMSHLDVFSYLPKEKPKTEEAAVVELADPNSVNSRKTFMTMPGVKRVLIGPSKGPLIPVMYSEETRMFFPVFKE